MRQRFFRVSRVVLCLLLAAFLAMAMAGELRLRASVPGSVDAQAERLSAEEDESASLWHLLALFALYLALSHRAPAFGRPSALHSRPFCCLQYFLLGFSSHPCQAPPIG